MVGETVPRARRRPKPPCRALDGLIVGGREVWLVVGREPAEVAALLSGPGDLTICRTVLASGEVVLERASAERDPLLSEVLEVLEDPALARP